MVPSSPAPLPGGTPREGSKTVSRVVVLILALLFWGLCANDARAQLAFAKKKFQVTVPYDGPEIFARLLDHAGIAPIRSFADFLDATPDKTILIVFGEDVELLRERDRRSDGIRGFLRDGGALLLALEGDFDFSRLRFMGWEGVASVKSHLVNDRRNFQDQRQCPIITGEDLFAPLHPLFQNVVNGIATNCPGHLTLPHADLQMLARLPFGTGPVNWNDNAKIITYPYIAATKTNAPRVLLFAGQGVFINCMVIRDDIDNRRLALNAIHWLKEGKRTQALFIHNGKVVQSFTMPLAGPPRMPVPTIAAINRIIDAIQNEQVLQKFLNPVKERIVQGLIILATFGLLLYGIKKYVQSRWSLEATPVLVGVPPAKSPSLVKQQVREMVRRQQLGEPAQALARDWFRSYAKIDFPAGQAPAEISFDIHAGIFQRRKLAKHIKTLWALASAPPPTNWDAKKLRDLSAFLQELSLSVLAGEVVFDHPVAAGARS